MNEPLLSKPEKQMLKLARESGGHRVTLEQLAKASGRSINYVYEKMQDPDFRELFSAALRGSLMSEMPEILGVFIEKAKEGSFAHGKLLLELTKVYNQESNLNINANVVAHRGSDMSAEERRQFLEATLKAGEKNE